MNSIKEQIEQLEQQFKQELAAAGPAELEHIKIRYLGRKGSVAALMAQLKDLSLEEKQQAGPALNALKITLQTHIEQKEQELARHETQKQRYAQEHFDVTASLYNPLQGTYHPYTKVIQELENIFLSMGFSIADGPELETDFYNFSALNIGTDHPARDMHDTFWIKDHPHHLLRTHTSTVQIRQMQIQKEPPFAIFSTGRVYRNEATDASHDFMFMQGEALYVDKNVSMANLLATAQNFLKAIFNNENIQIRVRPGYFPFVEPGVEIDASCPFCTKGCSVCKKSRWIELLGAGLVHPNVLSASGINPEEYRGFALGFGLTRIAMIKYGITDVRLFHSSKLSFLNQFSRCI